MSRISKKKSSTCEEEKSSKKQKVSPIENEQSSSSQAKTITVKSSTRLSSKGESATLKIVSWNINGIRAWSNGPGLKYLEEENADILCFQELKCDQTQIPSEVTPPGYKAFWLSGDKAGYAGVGLLTKIDPIDVRFGIDDEKHDAEGRVITAEFDKFYLVCSYIPNSGQKLVRLNYRQEFNVDFHRYLKSLQAKKPTIWCGDLNVAHEPIDLSNSKKNSKIAGHTKEEREDFSKILSDGFFDGYRTLYPEETDCFTFWSYFRNARSRNIGWRLDYFVLSDQLKENLCDVVHQTEVLGSDHCPIVLHLAI